jgi:hypothetical protein
MNILPLNRAIGAKLLFLDALSSPTKIAAGNPARHPPFVA